MIELAPSGPGELQRPSYFAGDGGQLLVRSTGTLGGTVWTGDIYEQSLRQVSASASLDALFDGSFPIGLLGDQLIHLTTTDTLVSIPLNGGDTTVLAPGVDRAYGGFLSPTGDELYFQARRSYCQILWMGEFELGGGFSEC